MNLVSFDDIKTIDDYLLYLLTFSYSMTSLNKLVMIAERKGILNQDEEELGRTIGFEARRCLQVIEDQYTAVLERTETDNETLVKKLQALVKLKMEK